MRRTSVDKVVMRIVRAYREALEAKKGVESVLMAYRPLSVLCKDHTMEMPLSREYLEWTGQAVPALPDPVVVMNQQTIPWGVYVCQSMSKAGQAPAHCIPVSVIEVAFLERLSEEHRTACIGDLVKRWSREQPQPPKQTMEETAAMLTEAGWEIDDVSAWARSSADSYWRSRPTTTSGSDEPMPQWVTQKGSANADATIGPKPTSSPVSRPSSGSVPDVSTGGDNEELPF